jgi:large subunit ribosomal protein L30
MAKVRITQVRSTIKCHIKQKLTIKALKLGRINKSVELEFTPQIQGMVRRVSHLVTTENIA